jgi:hypothetical protein
MEFIEIHHEVHVEPLLWVSEFVVFLDLYWEKKSDAPAILIVNQTFIVFVWSMSHFRTSMQGKMRVLIATMCKYNH